MSATNSLIRSRPNVVSPSALGRLRSLLAGQSSEPASPSSRAKALTTLQEANPRNLPEVWFSSTFPRPELPRSSPGFEQNPPPGPDGTKVKLGKSMSRPVFPSAQVAMLTRQLQNSLANPTRATPYPAPDSAAARHPEPKHLPAPVPVNTPPPARRLGPRGIRRRIMDFSDRMEPGAHRRERQA